MKKTKKIKKLTESENKELVEDTHKIMRAAIDQVCSKANETMEEFYNGKPLPFEQKLDFTQRLCHSLKAFLEKSGSAVKTVEDVVANYTDWEYFHSEALAMREVIGEWAFPASALNQMDDIALTGNHRDAHYVFMFCTTRYQFITLLKHQIEQDAKKKGKGITH
jgi:hypothetical protein